VAILNLGSSHQGNPKYGPTAGTQCVCNSLSSLCYSKIILPRYWTTNDIDSVLTFGNSEYSRLGYVHEYLSFDDIPVTFNLGEHIMELSKSERYSGYLNRESENFIQFVPPFTRGLFIAGGLTTCLMYQSNKVYIFDPHSRNDNGLVSHDGTAVLLKFDSLSKAMDYIKYFFLHRYDHPNYSVGYEYQLFNIEPSQLAIDSIKSSHRSENKKGKRKYTYANTKERVSKYRDNLSTEKKVIDLSNAKKRMVNLRTNATPEKKVIELSNARKRKANFRVNMDPVEAASYKLSDKERKRMMPVRKVLFKDSEIKTNRLPSRIKAFKTQIVKGPFYICVICNRTLYKTSVLLFLESKYEASSDVVFSSRVQSFDNLEYICRTCHSKLSKNKIPAQAVCNDLKICNVSDRFSDIRKRLL